jgi:hypothetical protein
MATPSENPSLSACFIVAAEAEPSVLSRVVEHFVVLNSLPDSVRLRRFSGGLLEITVKVRGLDEARSTLVAHKLRQIVTVRQVNLEIFTAGGDIHDYRESLTAGQAEMAKVS